MRAASGERKRKNLDNKKKPLLREKEIFQTGEERKRRLHWKEPPCESLQKRGVMLQGLEYGVLLFNQNTKERACAACAEKKKDPRKLPARCGERSSSGYSRGRHTLAWGEEKKKTVFFPRETAKGRRLSRSN